MDIWGRANDDCDTDAKAFWKQEGASGTLVTSADLCDEPWSLWKQGEKLPSNVKGNIKISFMTLNQQRHGMRGNYRTPRILMYQPDVNPEKAPLFQDKYGS
jgi:hypothetical protein